MRPLIVIPTFQSARSRSKGSGVTSIYDHTTQYSQPGELPRLFDSLVRVQGAYDIAVLVVAEPSIEKQAARKVHSIAIQYPQLNILVIGSAELALIRQRMEQLNLGRLNTQIDLGGYGAVRNLGLVLANILGNDACVFVDDDELIEDPDFLLKAMYGLGKFTKSGVPILAKTGFFYNADGSYMATTEGRWYNKHWDQGRLFNEWIEHAMRGPRLSRSNYVCGGCMALHREAFVRVAFDPWITRGEDLDYLLNLRMYGSDMWFDNSWSLKHLPPETGSEGQRFKQDVYRWLYEYRKMEYSRMQIDLLQVRPSSLQPYPGPFLEADVVKRLGKTAIKKSLLGSEAALYREAGQLIKGAAATYAERNCGKYFEFQRVWPEIQARLASDKVLQTALYQSAELRDAQAGIIRENTMESAEEQAAARAQAVACAAPSVDPGATAEIRLNIAD